MLVLFLRRHLRMSLIYIYINFFFDVYMLAKGDMVPNLSYHFRDSTDLTIIHWDFIKNNMEFNHQNYVEI